MSLRHPLLETLVVVADNNIWEDDISETGRDALDSDMDSEVEALCRELPVEEDCPSSRDEVDDDPEKPALPPEVVLRPDPTHRTYISRGPLMKVKVSIGSRW